MIGGSQLFNQLLPLASKIFMTQIDAKVDADAYAPDLSAAVEDGSWKLVENSGWQKPKKADGIKRFRYLTFERNRENGNNEEE
ncbi:diacylglycerol kinase [Bifidobacterium sp. GSD1FS]|uniref:Diacylglycerol kinase n=1 Tax=Bifidobacterium canis TaxID=2610880 RepID=A0A7K1J669_9BIFI|nr:diacylglycerol kinase [Bifidobacterium canis]